jgi:glutaredoxin-like protein NrdH
MSTITVFTKPACVQCRFTKTKLDQLGLTYDTIDISLDEAALEKVKGLGYLTAPVVLVSEDGEDTQHWGGFQPDRLIALKDAA